MRHLAIQLSVLVCCAICAPAAAQDARALLEQGKQQFSEARFKASIASLEAARKASRDAKLLGEIYLYLGLSNAVVGDMDRARECFATALGYDPTVKLDLKEFKEDLVKLLEEVRAERTGTLKVTADGAGATASIDSGPPQPLPLAIPVVAGPHTVKVIGPDGQVWLSETVTIGAKETKELRATPRVAAVQPADGKQPSFWGRRRIWTWVMLGTGAAILIAGGVVFKQHDGPLDEWGTLGCGNPDADDPKCKPLPDDAARYENTGYALIAVGGVIAAASLIPFFLEGRPSADTSKSSLRLSPLVGQTNGLQLVGRF